MKQQKQDNRNTNSKQVYLRYTVTIHDVVHGSESVHDLALSS